MIITQRFELREDGYRYARFVVETGDPRKPHKTVEYGSRKTEIDLHEWFKLMTKKVTNDH